MANRMRTVATVLLLAIAIWLFAEAESLGDYSGVAKVTFVSATGGSPRIAIVDESWDGRVNLEFKGSQSAIRQVQRVLSEGFVLSPEDDGMPPGRGELEVDLRKALQEHEGIRDSGIQMTTVEPTSVRVLVEDIVERQAPVIVELAADIAVEGAPSANPGEVTLRGPKRAFESNEVPEAIRITLTREQIGEARPGGGVRTVSVPVRLDRTLTDRGIEAVTKNVSVQFTLRSTIETVTWTDIPVQVLLPPIETTRWEVMIAADDRLLSAEVTGPAAMIDELRGSGAALLAILALSSDELEQRIESKEVSILARRDDVLAPLPGAVNASASKATVTFTIKRRETADE